MTTPVLAVAGLRAGIPGWDIVRDVAFDLHAGEILALLGPNGAGKTTLVRAVLQLCAARGRVLLHGHDLTRMAPAARARTIAYVPQQSRLLAPLSAREVVELGRYPHRGDALGLSQVDRVAVDAALAATDCRHLQNRAFATCSGGEQTRLLVARALATQAPCLVLDEPTASLDIAHTLDFFALVRRLAADGKAVLVVLHHLGDALRWADRALLLDAGQVVAQGPVAEVLSPHRVRQVYGVDMIPGAEPGFALPATEAACDP